MKTYLELEMHDDLRLEPQLSLLFLVLLLSSPSLLLLYCHVVASSRIEIEGGGGVGRVECLEMVWPGWSSFGAEVVVAVRGLVE
jgi:hypothetical protein